MSSCRRFARANSTVRWAQLNMKKHLQFYVIVILAVALFEVLASLASRMFVFDYTKLFWASWCIYFLAGFVGCKRLSFIGGITSGLAAGFGDANVRLVSVDGDWPIPSQSSATTVRHRARRNRYGNRQYVRCILRFTRCESFHIAKHEAVHPPPPNKPLELTRHNGAFIRSNLGEPLKRSVRRAVLRELNERTYYLESSSGWRLT
jgi:hypothetical protein